MITRPYIEVRICFDFAKISIACFRCVAVTVLVFFFFVEVVGVLGFDLVGVLGYDFEGVECVERDSAIIGVASTGVGEHNSAGVGFVFGLPLDLGVAGVGFDIFVVDLGGLGIVDGD